MFRERTSLRSELFPDKQTAWWLSTRYSYEVMGPLTTWISARKSPAELAATVRTTPLRASNFNGMQMQHLFGLLGYLLGDGSPVNSRPLSADQTIMEYWFGFFCEAATLDDPCPWGPTALAASRLSVLDASAVHAAGSAVVPCNPDERATVLAAMSALTSFSWLLECETRSGIFSHGPYEADGEQLLVREFQDVTGNEFPWAPQELRHMTAGADLAIVLRAPHFRATFDAFGTVSLDTDSLAATLSGVAVMVGGVTVERPIEWLRNLQLLVMGSYRRLFRTVASLSREERVFGQSLGIARHHARYLRAAGASGALIDQLLMQPLQLCMELWLAGEMGRQDAPAIWARLAAVSPDTRSTFLMPAIEALQTLDGRRRSSTPITQEADA
jgi:hypothetical protein